MSTTQKRILIIGQGLSGSHLALEGIRRGYHVTVVNYGRGLTSSRVSAGLLNPATGRRFALNSTTWQQWQTALRVYRYWEQRWKTKLLEPRSMWRPFQDDREKKHYLKRLDFLPAQRMMGKPFDFPYPEQIPPHWQGREAAYLNPVYLLQVTTFLDCTAEEVQQKGQLIKDWFHPHDMVTHTDHLYWKGERFDYLFFAQGCSNTPESPFAWIPLIISLGKILQFAKAPLHVSKEWILNCGHWYFCNQTGEGAKLGATADVGAVRSVLDSVLSSDSTRILPQQDKDIFPLLKTFGLSPDILTGNETVVQGYRPRTRDNQPIVGFHPKHHHVGILNGTGGRGGILCPYMALRLMAHIDHRLPLPAYSDCQRNTL